MSIQISSKGPLPDAIQTVWKRINNEFFPETKYQHAQLVELEVCLDGGISSEDYYCEVWILIIEKSLELSFG